MRRWLLIALIALAAVGALVWPTAGLHTPPGVLASNGPAKFPVEEEEIQEDATEELSEVTYREIAGAGAGACATACGARQAGFDWARDNDVGEAAECAGLSAPEALGCRAYAVALQRSEAELRKQADAGEL